MKKERIKLAKWGEILNTRFLGRKLREDILKALSNGKHTKIILDFSNTELITQSFADESIGKLIQAKGSPVLESLLFHDLNEDIRSVLNHVIDKTINDKTKKVTEPKNDTLPV